MGVGLLQMPYGTVQQPLDIPPKICYNHLNTTRRETPAMPDRTIIAATRSDEEFLAALRATPAIIFDLNPDIMTLQAKLRRAHEAGKKVYIHLDLAHGIGKDESGLRYLSRIGVDGIISTKTALIKQAREQELSTVQRFFILDSRSVETTIEALRQSHPDMLEIMPGIIPKAIRTLRAYTDAPIIAGGLIESADEVQRALEAGAKMVSTGCRALWDGKP